MARKEVHIDYHLFLILFSKAMGAMIILYVLVPKLTGNVKQKLEQLQQLEELKIEVSEVDSLMTALKKSVPEATYNVLNNKIKRIQEATKTLENKVKDLQNALAKCDERKRELQDKVNQLTTDNTKLDDQVRNNNSSVQTIKDEKERIQNELEVLKKQIADCDQLRKSLEGGKNDIQAQIVQLQKETEQQLLTLKNQEDLVKKQQDQLKEKDELIKKKDDIIKEQQKQIADCAPRVTAGFEIKDQNVVFLVDLSGSMDDNPEPEKLNEVVAGLKMMIATMDNSYKIDVVVFPKSIDEEYSAKYGKLVTVTEDVKYDIYNYLKSLKAYGCTPTREAIKYVFETPNYKSAGTVILLSDGIPTKRVSRTDCEDESPNDVVQFITQTNSGSKVINCVGVGSEFRTKGSSSAKVKFMRDVAKQNNGFYIGY